MKVRITTIRARLLIGFVLMATLSAIFISAGSIVVGYLNGQKQTRNRLDSVALSKELQISAWTDGLQNELTAILTEEYAISGLIYEIDYSHLSLSAACACRGVACRWIFWAELWAQPRAAPGVRASSRDKYHPAA